MDLYSRKIVAWTLSKTLEAKYVVETVRKAIVSTGSRPKVIHSDRGSQYTSIEYKRITNGIESSVPFLYMLRLLTISLGNADEVYAKRYNLDIGKVKEILPLAMNSIPGDYSLTPVGIIIAIINIHNKTNLNLDFKIWIKSV